MKKRLIISVAAMMLLLCSCRATPDSVEKDGVLIQQDSTNSVDSAAGTYSKEDVPERWQSVWENSIGEMEIDAKVVVPEGEITQGHVQAVKPDIEKIKELLLPDGTQDVTDTDLETSYKLWTDGQVEASLGFFDFLGETAIFYDRQNTAAGVAANSEMIDISTMSEEQLQSVRNTEQMTEDLLKNMNLNQTVIYRSMMKYENGVENIYFYVLPAIDGVACSDLAQFCGDDTYLAEEGTIVFEGTDLNSIDLSQDMEAVDKEPVEMLPFESIMEIAKSKFEADMMNNTKGSSPVDRISLEYIIEKDGTELTYRPIWVFRKNVQWVLEGVCCAFDAQTGEMLMTFDFGE